MDQNIGGSKALVSCVFKYLPISSALNSFACTETLSKQTRRAETPAAGSQGATTPFHTANTHQVNHDIFTTRSLKESGAFINNMLLHDT